MAAEGMTRKRISPWIFEYHVNRNEFRLPCENAWSEPEGAIRSGGSLPPHKTTWKNDTQSIFMQVAFAQAMPSFGMTAKSSFASVESTLRSRKSETEHVRKSSRSSRRASPISSASVPDGLTCSITATL